MTLREKFAADGTTLAGVQGNLAEECLDETVTEVGRDGKHVLSQLECGDYILDVLYGQGDTILILQSDIDEPSHADIRHLLPSLETACEIPSGELKRLFPKGETEREANDATLCP